MRYIALAVVFVMGTPAIAQPSPDFPMTFTITYAEYSKIWEIIGEQKMKEMFSLGVKLNNQAIKQLSAPQGEPNKEKAQ